MTFFRQHLAVFITIIITMLSLSSVYEPEPGSGIFSRTIQTIGMPIQHSVMYVVTGISDVAYKYFSIIDAHEESEMLRDENRRLGLMIAELKNVEQENARLRRLVEHKRRHPLKYFPARVIATDILGQFRTVTINAGSDNGVVLNSPVLDADGVIGRIVEVFSGYSRVLLMIDPNSSIDGRVVRTNAQGIIQGIKERDEMRCQFAFSLRTEDIRESDEIVTSGLDQLFPPGLKLGTVTEVSKADFGIFQEAKIKPAADFTRLQDVLVVLPGVKVK